MVMAVMVGGGGDEDKTRVMRSSDCGECVTYVKCLECAVPD